MWSVVTPGKGGTTHENIPVFNTVADSVREAGANVSVIYVPPAFAADAVEKLMPGSLSSFASRKEFHARHGEGSRVLRDKTTRLIGPNCPGSSR